MMTRINTCCTSLDYSERSARARSRQEQRSAPRTALDSQSGFHPVFTAMIQRWRRSLEKASWRKNKLVAAVFERTEDYRPTDPHWYLSPIGAVPRSPYRDAGPCFHDRRQSADRG